MKLLKRIIEVFLDEGLGTILLKVTGKIKSIIFMLYVSKRNWEKAINIGEDLIVLFPNNRIYHLKLAGCYQNINNPEKANKLIEKCMKLNFNLTEVIELAEQGLSNIDIVESSYIYIGGDNNSGMILHNLNQVEYITKIVQSKHKVVERFFYNKVYNRLPNIKSNTPKLINFREVKEYELCLVTMEKIDGIKISLKEDEIFEVGRLSRLINSTRYGEVKEWFSLVVQNHNHKLHHLLWSFGLIHTGLRNKQNFEMIYKTIGLSTYSTDTYYLFKRLERVILKEKVYDLIIPSKHYTIQHGDYFHWNLLWDKKSGKLLVLDWGEMRIGPSWCDMAGFLGEIKYPFQKVKLEFLNKQEVSGHFEPIEKLFFIYTLIMVWFCEFNVKEFERNKRAYLIPAIEYIEELYQEDKILSVQKNIVYQN